LEAGLLYNMEKKYEHSLQHSAWNFVVGPFGGVYGEISSKFRRVFFDCFYFWVPENSETFLDKDFICVQSFDGVLSFFEQDVFAFTRYLNNFLLPGPLCYVSRTDSFITCTSSMEASEITSKFPIHS
jgi:Bardet-Biedl syndrome 9 protein